MTLKKVLIASGAALSAAACTDGPQKPNIVFFFCDDIGAECFGCYGGVTFDTHRIDALARQGILYSNMNAMPLSTPSRVQVMTGRYNDKNYVNFGFMNDDENTFAHLAREAGYSTGIFGKWQLGRSREMISELGFDEYGLVQLELYTERRKGQYISDRYANCLIDKNGEYDFSVYGPYDLQKCAFRYIDEQVEAGRPFLLYYTEPLVHTPHTTTPDTELWDTDYDTRFARGVNLKYFPDMVKYLDRQVGEFADYLKEKGIWDNTIFIFCSDNGTVQHVVSTMSDGSEVRGGKGKANYRGTHVPLIVTWGDRLAGRKSDRLVDLTDILPTMADAMGVKVPEAWDVDGISLYPELCGDTPLERELTLVHFNPLWPTQPTPGAARYAMDKDRYAYFWDGRIYDYRTDPEFQNPVRYDEASDELKSAVAPLKEKVEEFGEFYPDVAGTERRGKYRGIYDYIVK